MDATTLQLADFASRAEFSGLSADTVRECKRRLIDTVACVVGAYDEPLSRMARRFAKRSSGTSTAPSPWGCTWKTTPEAAAFANGVMMRFLDFNDTYFAKGQGHPSGVIPGILAVGEAVHASGAATISAVTLGYDMFCGFCESVDLNSKGWDCPVYVALGTAVGAGKLLGLSQGQMANAVSLSLVCNMALGQTRRGELSDWKGVAEANASRNGVFAAMMAQDGLTGPSAIFEGKNGLWDVVGHFEWTPAIDPKIEHGIVRTHLKPHELCSNGQSAVNAALELRPQVSIEDIDSVQIETYKHAVDIMGTSPERWAPKTRETADHSLPYVVAIALMDGEVTAHSFNEKRLMDEATLGLMKKIKVIEDTSLTAQFPDGNPCRLKIRSTAGREMVSEVKYPKGHHKNPMNDADLEAKFRTTFRTYGGEKQCEAVLSALWNLDGARDIGDVMRLLVAQRAEDKGTR